MWPFSLLRLDGLCQTLPVFSQPAVRKGPGDPDFPLLEKEPLKQLTGLFGDSSSYSTVGWACAWDGHGWGPQERQ